MLPSSVPLNPAVSPLLTTGEKRVTSVPPVVKTEISADTCSAAGHPVEVDQVGVDAAAPVGGFRARLPGCVPTAASADPAVVTAAPAVRPTSPRITALRRSRPAVPHFNFSFMAGFFSLSSGGRA